MITEQEIETLMKDVDKVLNQHEHDKFDNFPVYMKLQDIRADLFGLLSDVVSEDWNKSHPIQNA